MPEKGTRDILRERRAHECGISQERVMKPESLANSDFEPRQRPNVRSLLSHPWNMNWDIGGKSSASDYEKPGSGPRLGTYCSLRSGPGNLIPVILGFPKELPWIHASLQRRMLVQ